MKISLNWLSEFIEWKERDPNVIVDRLTVSTAEVEKMEEQGEMLRDCCVGKVISVSKHPNADTLSLANVETDRGVKKVVCGGTNVREGMLVAFAHIGATVKWHGGELMTLEPVKIRGEASEGMICAAEELGIEGQFPQRKEDGERPIVDLSTFHFPLSTSPVGSPLRNALNLTDTILSVSNTAITNRPDLFSHLGFARECVALGLAKWKKNAAPNFPLSTFHFPSTPLPFKSHNTIPKLIPFYRACLLSMDAPGETPDWMKRRLEATGWRSVSLPVDITNYVTMELGMPLHSFDADDLRGDIHFRTAKKGEKLTTLDEVERTLPEGAVVLSDDKGLFDLLGIMGGLRSHTRETTRRIYLHSAIVDPATIRLGITGTGHRTDAATIYEKGIPFLTAEQGFARALELFLSLVPGTRIVSRMEKWGTLPKPQAISISSGEIGSILGQEVPEKDITRILQSLGCTVTVKKKSLPRPTKNDQRKTLLITPPPHRLRDLKEPPDVVEEIGRIIGYPSIEEQMPSAPVRLPEKDMAVHVLRESLRANGYLELVPLAFVSPALLKKSGMDPSACVAVMNPLGEETSLLCPSTLPALLEHAEKFCEEEGFSLRTFQWGHVFDEDGSEHMEMAALSVAKDVSALNALPVLTLQQQVLDAAKASGYPLDLHETKDLPAFAHPGRISLLSAQGKAIGFIFELHPTIIKNFGLPERSAAAILNLSCLLNLPPVDRSARPLPRFPGIIYDVTVQRLQKSPLASLLRTLEGGHPLLKDVSVKDVFAPEGKADPYQLTLRCTYRADDRTLTEEEAKKAHEEVMRKTKEVDR